jgi:hypothetical protein
VRRALEASYGGRISSTESKLEELQSEQRATIEKLKAATKYSTTQSLIEKYGNTTGTSIQKAYISDVRKAQRAISYPNANPAPHTAALKTASGSSWVVGSHARANPHSKNNSWPNSKLAFLRSMARLSLPIGDPNRLRTCFVDKTFEMQSQTQPPSRQHLQPEEATAPRWYDRILDVILGEDETSAQEPVRTNLQKLPDGERSRTSRYSDVG